MTIAIISVTFYLALTLLLIFQLLAAEYGVHHMLWIANGALCTTTITTATQTNNYNDMYAVSVTSTHVHSVHTSQKYRTCIIVCSYFVAR